MPRKNTGPRLRWLAKRGAYYVFWTEGGRSRERSTGTSDSGEAQIFFAEFLHERQRKSGPSDPAAALVTDVLADYAEERGGSVQSPERIAYAIAPLAEFWTGKTVAAVTRETCAAYTRWRERAPGTVRRELGVLRAAIGHAHGEGRLTRTVAVSLPEKPDSKQRWLTKPEAAALLRAALRSPKVRLYLPLFLVIGLHTGARKEAILSLRWNQVDLEAGRISWNPSGRLQTKKRRPNARIPPKLLSHLRRARARGTDLGYVISDDNGRRILDVKKSFTGACRRAGLAEVTPHTMRHTRATWGMQRGVPVWELAGFLGMSPETLQAVYGHHHPDYQKHAAETY